MRTTEKCLIGDMKSFRDPALIAEAAKNEPKIVVKSLGLAGKIIGKNFAVVIPSSRTELISMLKQCDMQDGGRSPFSGYDTLVGLPNQFVLSTTGSEAVKLHNKFRAYINSPSYESYFKIAEEVTLAEIKNITDLNKRTITIIVRNVLARVILGTVEPLSTKFHSILDKNSLNNTVHFIPSKLRLFGDTPSGRRKDYKLTLQEFFESLLPSIEVELKTNTDGPYKSYLIASLVDAVKKDHSTLNSEEFYILLKSMDQYEILAFLNTESFIDSLPLLLLAGEALVELIMISLNNLEFDDRDAVLPAQLRGYYPFGDIESKQTINCHYKESLRHLGAITPILRYTRKEIITPSMRIPADTHIIFKLGPLMDNPKFGEIRDQYEPLRFHPDAPSSLTIKDFSTFSAGQRMCPAFKITEYIYEAVIATLIRQCNLTKTDDNEFKITKP